MKQPPPTEVPTLCDGVVVLNAFELSDVERHLAGDDFENRKWLNDHYASSVETVTLSICNWREDWRIGAKRRGWAIREPESNALMGGCEIRLAYEGIGQLSYWIFPEYRGHGYAARAMRLVVEYAFEHFGIERAEVDIEVDNHASRGVARQAGFVEEGVLRKRFVRDGQRRDLVRASKLKGE